MSRFFIWILLCCSWGAAEWHLPILVENRQSWFDVQLTGIGHFGHYRPPRPGIPEHLHTAIDLKRPSDDYCNEPIFSIAKGTVISFRDDGPYAQIIIEHVRENDTLWSVYEHLGAVEVYIGQRVDENRRIGRFMNRTQLDRYGHHFDHVHLEIMKVHPPKRQPHPTQENLLYGTYALVCYTRRDLHYYYHAPHSFFTEQWR